MTLKVDPGLVDVLKLRFSHLEKIREPCHAETGFETFFVVIPKECLVGTGWLGYTSKIASVIPKKGLVPSQAFFIVTTKKTARPVLA